MTAEQFADGVASITGEWPALSRVANPPAGGRGAPVGNFRRPVRRRGDHSRRAGRRSRPGRRTCGSCDAWWCTARWRAWRSGRRRPTSDHIPIAPANYVREWRIAGSALDRALGRPIRDQVYSTRDTQATTIQALELVNGGTLTHWLWRGARRMLGELPPEPVSLLSRQMNNIGRAPPPVETPGAPAVSEAARAPSPVPTSPAPFEVDVSKSQKLYLIVRDSLSTAPDKAAPLWIDAELSGPDGTTPLSALKPLNRSGLREDNSPLTIAGGPENGSALRVTLSSVLVYDIAGKGFTRFKGATGFEAVPLTQGEIVQARFFVFDREPDMDRLVPPNPETPLAARFRTSDGLRGGGPGLLVCTGPRAVAGREKGRGSRLAQSRGLTEASRRRAGGSAVGGNHDAGVSTDSLGIIDERRREIDRLKAQPPRVYGYGRDGGSHACGADRPRTAGGTRRRPGGHGGFHHRALDGRRHGADRDIRPEAVHAIRARRAYRASPQHVSGDRHCRSTISKSPRGSSASPR